jgi:hypothetical protein
VKSHVGLNNGPVSRADHGNSDDGKPLMMLA